MKLGFATYGADIATMQAMHARLSDPTRLLIHPTLNSIATGNDEAQAEAEGVLGVLRESNKPPSPSKAGLKRADPVRPLRFTAPSHRGWEVELDWQTGAIVGLWAPEQHDRRAPAPDEHSDQKWNGSLASPAFPLAQVMYSTFSGAVALSQDACCMLHAQCQGRCRTAFLLQQPAGCSNALQDKTTMRTTIITIMSLRPAGFSQILQNILCQVHCCV